MTFSERHDLSKGLQTVMSLVVSSCNLQAHSFMRYLSSHTTTLPMQNMKSIHDFDRWIDRCAVPVLLINHHAFCSTNLLLSDRCYERFLGPGGEHERYVSSYSIYAILQNPSIQTLPCQINLHFI